MSDIQIVLDAVMCVVDNNLHIGVNWNSKV